MKQTVLTGPYTLEVRECEIPSITQDQVLIKVRSFGICGSDIQMYHGLHKYMTYPVVIGHEVAATVVKTGKNVHNYEENDNVTVEPQVTCGKCYPCSIGRFNVCQHLKVIGVHQDGFAGEYFAIEPSYLHACKGLNSDQTALIEPLAVGMGSVKRAGNLSGKNIVVIGAGTIGNLVAQSAKALGADKVMVTDVKQKKLDYAKKCGVEFCINTTDKKLKDIINDTFGTQKADVIIDCAATRSSMLSALEAARPSSQIIVTGNFKAPVEIELPIIQRQEINLVGHMMYVREDFSDAIRFIREGRICLDGFATQHYTIDKLHEAFKFIDENPDDVMKVMVSL